MKKLLAILLTLVMMLSLGSIALAEDIQTEVSDAVDVAFVTFMTGIPYFDDSC